MATKVQLTEERARELAQQADLRVRTNLEFKKENGEPQKPTQARMLRLATAPTEKQLAESQRKADKERLKAMPKDERKVAKARIDWSKRLEEQEEAKRKLEKAKRDLEAAKEKNDPKAIKKAQKSVEKAQKDYDKSVVATQNAREKYNASQADRTPKGMAKRADELKKRDMENKKKEEELKKKKAKKKEGELKNKYNHIKLPSGMIIKQQGPQWVLVDPRTNPSRTKDVTAEMNAFVRANKAIDEANLQIERNNKLNANGGALAGAGVEEGYKTSAQMTENTVAGMTTGQMKGVDNKAISTPAITDVDNKPLSEDDVKALARVSVERAFDENLFERLYGRKLKGPLEKGASALRSETDEERKRKEEEAARLAAQRRQNGGKE